MVWSTPASPFIRLCIVLTDGKINNAARIYWWSWTKNYIICNLIISLSVWKITHKRLHYLTDWSRRNFSKRTFCCEDYFSKWTSSRMQKQKILIGYVQKMEEAEICINRSPSLFREGWKCDILADSVHEGKKGNQIMTRLKSHMNCSCCLTPQNMSHTSKRFCSCIWNFRFKPTVKHWYLLVSTKRVN